MYQAGIRQIRPDMLIGIIHSTHQGTMTAHRSVPGQNLTNRMLIISVFLKTATTDDHKLPAAFMYTDSVRKYCTVTYH